MNALGEDTEGMADSTAKARQEMLALSGVDIMANATTFKSTYDILDDLSSKWQNLTDIQQASVTELIAGKRQGNIISALMSNFDVARESVATADSSDGSAMKEHANYQKSIQYSLDVTKAKWQEFSTSLISTDVFKGVVDGAGNLLEMVTAIMTAGGGAGGVGLLGTLFGGGAFLKNLD